jgi:hypothetical protein
MEGNFVKPITSDDLLREIFKALLESTSNDWVFLELIVIGMGSSAGFTSKATAENGAQAAPHLSTDGAMHCLALRKAMYQPSKGTWYSARFAIDDKGNCNARYDYDSIPLDPDFDETLEDIRDSLVEDQELFPRDQEFLPEWHPCRDNS